MDNYFTVREVHQVVNAANAIQYLTLLSVLLGIIMTAINIRNSSKTARQEFKERIEYETTQRIKLETLGTNFDAHIHDPNAHHSTTIHD